MRLHLSDLLMGEQSYLYGRIISLSRKIVIINHNDATTVAIIVAVYTLFRCTISSYLSFSLNRT